MNDCPSCCSDKTMTKRMAHDQYTVFTESKATTSNLSLSAASPVLALGTSQGSALAQTRLAVRCAPPENPHPEEIMWRGYAWIMGLFAFFIVCSGAWFEGGFRGAFWLVVFCVVGALLYLLNTFSIDYYARKHNARELIYDHTWICLTCGHEWVRK
jgi:hypothetical protein